MANGEASGVPGSGDGRHGSRPGLMKYDTTPLTAEEQRLQDESIGRTTAALAALGYEPAIGVDIGDGTGQACVVVPGSVGEFIVKNMKAWDGLGLAGVGIADAADEPAIVAPCACRTWAYDECDSMGPTDSGHHPRCPGRLG